MKYEFMYNIRLQVNKAIQLKPHKSPQTPLRAIRQQINVIYDPRVKTKKRKVALLLLLLLPPPRRFTSASREEVAAEEKREASNVSIIFFETSLSPKIAADEWTRSELQVGSDARAHSIGAACGRERERASRYKSHISVHYINPWLKVALRRAQFLTCESICHKAASPSPPPPAAPHQQQQQLLSMQE